MSSFEIKIGGRLLPPAILQAVQDATLDQRLMLPARLDMTLFGVAPDLAAESGLKVGSQITFTTIHDDDQRKELFTGTIAAFEVDQSPSGTLCRVRAFDALHALTGGRRTRTFLQQKISDIVQKVLQEAGVSATVSATSQVHEHVLQLDENDYDFVVRLALTAGMVLRVDAKAVVMEPVPKASAAPKGSHDLGTPAKPLELTVGLNVLAWRGRVTHTESVKSVVVDGWDPTTQKAVTAKATPAGSLVANGSTPKSRGELHISSPLATTSAVTELVKGYAEAVGNLHTELAVEALGSPGITVGKAISFGNVGQPFDGRYTVTHAVHRFDADGYVTETDCTTMGDRSLLGTVVGGIDQPQNRWNGTVVGLVTNIQDPKKQGRVKVTYPWLAQSGGSSPESGWARVIHLGAGQNKQGLLILPAVNDEVMVVFEHGSPDHPVVLGGTYNGKHLPSVPGYVGDQIAQQLWRSGSGHEIAMIDEKGKEQIRVTSGDKDVTITIDKAGKAVKVTTKQSAVDVTAGGAVTVNSKQDVTLKGTNVTIEAKAGIKLKGATAELSASGPVTVKGAIIKLN